MKADVSPHHEGHRSPGRLLQFVVLVVGFAIAVTTIAPASADIFAPDWSAEPLPEGAGQPGAFSVGGAGCGPSGAVVFEDDFGTDGAPERAETGQAWETVGTGIFAVDDGTLRYASLEDSLSYLIVDTEQPDGRLSMTLTDLPETFWILWRYRNVRNHYRFGRENNGDYKFHQIVNGSITAFAPFSLDITPREGDRIAITFEEDDSMNVYRDDDWLYGDGITFNIDETIVGFALSDLDGSGVEFDVDDLELAPYSVAAATARVVVSAFRGEDRVAFDEFIPDNNGNWQGRFTIPDDAGDGDYRLTAECSTPGYDLIYEDLNTRLVLLDSETAITDFIAEVDFSEVEDARTFDPVTIITIAVLMTLTLGVAGIGLSLTRRRHRMLTEG